MIFSGCSICGRRLWLRRSCCKLCEIELEEAQYERQVVAEMRRVYRVPMPRVQWFPMQRVGARA